MEPSGRVQACNGISLRLPIKEVEVFSAIGFKFQVQLRTGILNL